MELVGARSMTKQIVQISRLAKGTVLLIETQHSIYEIEILDPYTGMSMASGGENFKIPQELFIDCSAWQDELYEGAIMVGYAIIFVSKQGNMFHTSKVKSVKITGPNNSYSYELE